MINGSPENKIWIQLIDITYNNKEICQNEHKKIILAFICGQRKTGNTITMKLDVKSLLDGKKRCERLQHFIKRNLSKP